MKASQFVVHGRFAAERSGAGLSLVSAGMDFEVAPINGTAEDWNSVLAMCDGKNSLENIQRKNPQLDGDEVSNILHALSESKLAFVVGSGADFVSGDEAMLNVEDLQAELLYNHLYQSKFWRQLENPTEVPRNVYYGMAIENFHFLFRESWFDSPVLSFQTSTKARLVMNEFYGEEYGHDELVLKALNFIGITREDITETRPLPETLALCNALAYWAANEPLFFFTTMGILEGKDIKVDSYILAMQNSKKIAPEFIKPILDHANINIKAAHGSLTRKLFREIDVVSAEQLAAMRANTRLFVELYNNFHDAVWDYYSNEKNPLLRRLSDITKAAI